MTRYFIHAGAHRTGSSSFQMCLHLNRAALTEAGYDLAYPGRDGAPGGTLELRLPSPRHGSGPHPVFTRKTARHLSAYANGSRPLILSEENIAGRMFHFYFGQFYPAAEARLKVLRAALDGPVARLVLVLRPYAALYASAYRKRAEDNAVRPFAQIIPRLMQMDRGWPEIVRVMRDLLAPEAFEVVPFAARGTSAQLLARLVPGAWAEPEEVVNLSATDAALEALQARYHAGETLDRAAWKAVIAAHAGNTGRTFAAFSEAQRAELDARYNADLARIAAMDGVRLSLG